MTIEMANRLIKLRKKQGLSQEALAEQLGVSRQSVSKWERAEASPDLDNLIALANLYGITMDELIHGVAATEKVHISHKEIYVDDGQDRVHIRPGHIFVEENGQETVHIGQEKSKAHRLLSKLNGIYIFLVCIAFFLWGFGGGWYIAWTLFLTIPVAASLAGAIIKRNPLEFAYPILVTFVYLLGGMLLSWWGSAWLLFLTIPVYYAVAGLFCK